MMQIKQAFTKAKASPLERFGEVLRYIVLLAQGYRFFKGLFCIVNSIRSVLLRSMIIP